MMTTVLSDHIANQRCVLCLLTLHLQVLHSYSCFLSLFNNQVSLFICRFHVSLSNIKYPIWASCMEKQCLGVDFRIFLTCYTWNLFHLISKTHIQLLVEFIQDNMLKSGEIKMAILQVVFNMTWGPNQDINPTLPSFNLTTVGISIIKQATDSILVMSLKSLLTWFANSLVGTGVVPEGLGITSSLVAHLPNQRESKGECISGSCPCLHK